MENLKTNLVHIDFDRDIKPHLKDEPVWDAFLRIVKERDEARAQLEKLNAFWLLKVDERTKQRDDVLAELELTRLLAKKMRQEARDFGGVNFAWAEKQPHFSWLLEE